MAFDLSQASAAVDREDEGIAVHIHDESDKPLYHDDKPVTVTVVGTYSRHYRRIVEAKTDLRQSGRTPSIHESALDTLTKCVRGWYGFLENGQPLDCTPANVRRVLELAPWVYEQVQVAMVDHAGFTRSSSDN